jgi:hypothetical protein
MASGCSSQCWHARSQACIQPYSKRLPTPFRPRTQAPIRVPTTFEPDRQPLNAPKKQQVAAPLPALAPDVAEPPIRLPIKAVSRVAGQRQSGITACSARDEAATASTPDLHHNNLSSRPCDRRSR